MRILVAEDEILARRTVAALLRKAGHEVVEAEDGNVAWELLQHPDPPALVVLDLLLPYIDGLELLRRVRASMSTRQPYVLMLTARGEKADIIAGLNAGANDYLAKPFDRGELLARIRVGVGMMEAREKLNETIKDLRAALDHIKTLRGILPMCSHCKKIRDDKGYWNQVEDYILQHSEAELSHALCPECLKTLYPDFRK